ncbi:MAG: hypothetical protein QW270_06650 [Candidatus Bathyarchaeia archaeon]
MNERVLHNLEAYRITILKQIREKLGIQEGDMVEAVIIRKIEKSSVAPYVLTMEKLQKERESEVQ